MNNIKLYSMRFCGKWYAIKSFGSMQKCNAFLENNPEFGLLCEAKAYSGKTRYLVAHNDDRGAGKLDIYYDGGDPGFCKEYYRAKCGRLFVMIPEGLHTCNDDDWREPDSPVNEDFFNIHKKGG